MKHKHYDMIVAKAENMDLVVFSNDFYSEASMDYSGWGEVEDFTKVMFTGRDLDIFLCLPEHKDACLHWLNGGDVQDFFENEWSDCGGANAWEFDHMFMDEDAEYRIKPKKQKCWIGVYGNYVTETHYPKRTLLERAVNKSSKYKHCNSEGWEFIEIEVEL